jgi:hypothetical protein
MIEIMKTLFVSLSFAATGAGIAWSVTSDVSEPFPAQVLESVSSKAPKGNRLDISPAMFDVVPAAGSLLAREMAADR